MSLRSQFLDLDDALATYGVPPMTTWWRAGIGEWLDAYEAGGAMEIFACVGRGAAKSTALYKLALFFTLFGAFVIPPGERHFAMVLSRQKDEAAKGIAIIANWMRMLKVGHRVAGDVIELSDMPRGLRVAAASVAATSGWRSFFVGKDERSKWPMSGVVEEHEAEEIDTSATAMTATHPTAPIVSFGSAWGAFGGFYDAIMSGTDATKVVLGPTPTWVAAPHMTEATCRRKERDERRFAREYACVFSSASSGALDPVAVLRTGRETGALIADYPPVMITDSSAGRCDSWVWAVAQWLTPYVDEQDQWLWSGPPGFERAALRRDATGAPMRNPDFRTATPVLFVRAIGAVDGGTTLSFDHVVARIDATAKEYGATFVHGDQYQEYPLTSSCAKRGLAYVKHNWDNASKIEAIARLRTLLRDEMLLIERTSHGDTMRRQLSGLEEKITAAGSLTYGGRRATHDDYAAICITLAMADAEGVIPGSPIKKPSGSSSSGPGDFSNTL